MKNQRGITLIALVITIVILIILAGVAINMTLGENGILEKAKYAKEQYEIAGVREEIELAILEIQSDKASKNEDFSIEAILAELPSKVEGITLEKEGNSLKGSFNGYNFTINESMKLAIEGESIEVEVSTEVKQYIGKDANGKYAVKVLLTLNSEETIDTIKIENTDGSTTEETIGNNTYSKEIELELDKEYRINIESENGAKTAKKISVSSITNISNVEQFVAFRDSVNAGLTYEGATINLTSDIDLARVCYKVDGTTTKDVSWQPIGNATNLFKGIFDGNNKEIKHIYINTTNTHKALFGYSEGVIKNVILKGGKITNTSGGYVAGICVENIGTLEHCINEAEIESTSVAVAGIVVLNKGKVEKCGNKGPITGKIIIGGIAANSRGQIYDSYNTAKIIATGTDDYNTSWVGGIVGKYEKGSNLEISNCYNTGNIEATGEGIGGICGTIAYANTDSKKISNCYNIGTVSGNAGIIGGVNDTVTISNCYWTNSNIYCQEGDSTTNIQNVNNVEIEQLKAYTATLGDAYTDDIEIEEGKWKYNNGYPILKWQISK